MKESEKTPKLKPVVQAASRIARRFAANSIEAACDIFIYQPKVPRDMADRLKDLRG
jgi:cyclic lactone autoinducer peptide